jgi:UDP-GlcNAc:undecaprenyl-phosphate GlcNAc-1-phosphate transferase
MGIYYAMVCLGATMLAIILTPLVVRAAQAWNIMDEPGVRKIHASAIPRIGGAAIVLAMLGMILPLFFIDNHLGEIFRRAGAKVVVILAAGGVMFAVGLADDILDLRARVKLLSQILAAMAICSFGIRIENIEITDRFVLNFGWWSWPLTIFWIVGITNAVNLIDGLDGLAAGIAAVTCGVIAMFAFYTEQPVMAVMMMTLLGSLIGFLFFNFNPAKVFMGDCGTMFIGFILAASSVMCTAKTTTLVGLALPALALGIPIFDTLFSIIRRILERRSIFSPDRGHIHHKLLDMGLRHRHVVIVMYLITLATAGLGMFMMFTRNMGTIFVLVAAILILLGTFRMVGAVRIGQSISVIQRNLNIARQCREDKQVFERSVLRMREVSDFQGWWNVLGDTAERMEIVRMSMNVICRDGTTNTMIWQCSRRELTTQNVIRIVLPVHDRRSGPPLQMELAVHVNGSLETAGRRVAYFSRLIDEYCPATIPRNTSTRICDYIVSVQSVKNNSTEKQVASASMSHSDEPELETNRAS